MKKNMLLGLFVFCIVSFTLMFNVKTTLSTEIVCNNFAYGYGSTVNGSLIVSDKTVGESAASENGFHSTIRANGGEFEATQFFETLPGGDAMYSLQNINKNASEQDRPNHIKVQEMMTTAGVEVLGEDRMKISQAGLGNAALLYSGSHNSSMEGHTNVLYQEVESYGDGSVTLGGRAHSFVYLGPDHGGSISNPDWTQENITEIGRDYVKFDWRQSGPSYGYQGQQLIDNTSE